MSPVDLCNPNYAALTNEFNLFCNQVHYMNDKERGHVWEQLMIMLPQHVILVLLSATLPNAQDFADWLGRIRGRSTIHVSATNKRPVPLEHFLYTGRDSQTRENVYLLLDKESRFILTGEFRSISLSWSRQLHCNILSMV